MKRLHESSESVSLFLIERGTVVAFLQTGGALCLGLGWLSCSLRRGGWGLSGGRSGGGSGGGGGGSGERRIHLLSALDVYVDLNVYGVVRYRKIRLSNCDVDDDAPFEASLQLDCALGDGIGESVSVGEV